MSEHINNNNVANIHLTPKDFQALKVVLSAIAPAQVAMELSNASGIRLNFLLEDSAESPDINHICSLFNEEGRKVMLSVVKAMHKKGPLPVFTELRTQHISSYNQRTYTHKLIRKNIGKLLDSETDLSTKQVVVYLKDANQIEPRDNSNIIHTTVDQHVSTTSVIQQNEPSSPTGSTSVTQGNDQVEPTRNTRRFTKRKSPSSMRNDANSKNTITAMPSSSVSPVQNQDQSTATSSALKHDTTAVSNTVVQNRAKVASKWGGFEAKDSALRDQQHAAADEAFKSGVASSASWKVIRKTTDGADRTMVNRDAVVASMGQPKPAAAANTNTIDNGNMDSISKAAGPTINKPSTMTGTSLANGNIKPATISTSIRNSEATPVSTDDGLEDTVIPGLKCRFIYRKPSDEWLQSKAKAEQVQTPRKHVPGPHRSRSNSPVDKPAEKEKTEVQSVTPRPVAPHVKLAQLKAAQSS